MSYETLDTIADSYIPLLALVLLMSMMVVANNNFINSRKSRNKSLDTRAFSRRDWIAHSFVVVLAVVGVYALGIVDKMFHLWPKFSLDYSTHTALALVLVVNIMVLQSRKSILWICVLSFVAYVILMHYQGYHTFLDMLSTALAITLMLVFIFGLQRVLRKFA